MRPEAGLPVSASWAEHLRACRDAGATLDCILLAVVLVSLLRFWAALSAVDVLLLLVTAAGSAAMLWWRRTHHAAYRRWSAAPRALQRLIVSSPPCWKVTQQVLAGRLPYGHGTLPDVALFVLLVLFTSCSVTGNGMALAHPLPLWLHLPGQAAVIGFVRHHTPRMCASPAMQQPPTQAAMRSVYSSLTALLSLLPLPAAAPQHSSLGRCVAVMSLAELLLGFLLPTLALAAWEAQQFQCWCRYWVAWQRQEQAQQHEQQLALPAGGASGSSGPGNLPAAAARTTWCAAAVSAGAAPAEPFDEPDPSLCPFLQPPSRAAAAFYRLLLACCRPAEVADRAAAAAAATLLLLATWQLVLLLTP